MAAGGRRCPRRAASSVSSRMRRAWPGSVVACLTAVTFGISASSASVSGSRFDDHSLRDVVDDDRAVGGVRDRAEVSHDPARGRLVVVRRDDEEAVDAELVSLPGEVYRVCGRIRARTGDHGRAVSHRLDRRREEGQPLVVAERRRLAGRAGDDDAVRARLDEMAAEARKRVQVDGSVPAEGRGYGCQDIAEHGSHCSPQAACIVNSRHGS